MRDLVSARDQNSTEPSAKSFFAEAQTDGESARVKRTSDYADELLKHPHWRLQPLALIARSLAGVTTSVGR